MSAIRNSAYTRVPTAVCWLGGAGPRVTINSLVKGSCEWASGQAVLLVAVQGFNAVERWLVPVARVREVENAQDARPTADDRELSLIFNLSA